MGHFGNRWEQIFISLGTLAPTKAAYRKAAFESVFNCSIVGGCFSLQKQIIFNLLKYLFNYYCVKSHYDRFFVWLCLSNSKNIFTYSNSLMILRPVSLRSSFLCWCSSQTRRPPQPSWSKILAALSSSASSYFEVTEPVSLLLSLIDLLL